MIIVCPNCAAEYLSNSKEKKPVGQNCQCLQCKQKWFQYNISNDKKTKVKEINSLKNLALDEYRISEENTSIAKKFEDQEANENIKLRLQKSSERLEENNQKLRKGTSETSQSSSLVANSTPSLIDNSTIIGFLFVSLISISLTVLYVYHYTIQKFIPKNIDFISDYKKLIDRGILATQDLINTIIQLIP